MQVLLVIFIALIARQVHHAAQHSRCLSSPSRKSSTVQLTCSLIEAE
jgi:hypothetical protein